MRWALAGDAVVGGVSGQLRSVIVTWHVILRRWIRAWGRRELRSPGTAHTNHTLALLPRGRRHAI